MSSGAPKFEKGSPLKMLGTLSVLKWVPNLDKIEETLVGNVHPEQGDIVSRGGQWWPKKPE